MDASVLLVQLRCVPEGANSRIDNVRSRCRAGILLLLALVVGVVARSLWHVVVDEIVAVVVVVIVCVLSHNVHMLGHHCWETPIEVALRHTQSQTRPESTGQANRSSWCAQTSSIHLWVGCH